VGASETGQSGGVCEQRRGMVKVAFFGGLDTLQRVEDPGRAEGSGVQVASLLDLAGMKMRMIQARVFGDN
jgi:hypothetical protein